jgi:hypothetical protein
MGKLRTIVLLLLAVLCGTLSANSQAVGDFRSVANGVWDSVATWEQYNGSTWVAATVAPNDTTLSVTVSANDTVEYTFSSRRVFNLTVEAGGLLWAKTGNTTTNRYIRVYGSVIKNDGQIGAVLDGLGLEFAHAAVLTGSGKNYICRIRPVSNVIGASFTFDADAMITYQGSSGTGGSGVYSLNSGNDSITYAINFLKTVTFVDMCNFATSGTSSAEAAINATFKIDGIADLLGKSNFSLRTTAGKTGTLIVSGSLKVGQNFYLSSATGGPNAITVNTNAVLQVGTGTPGTCDFANPANIVTGTGIFALLTGEKVTIGSPDGLTKTAAAGPVQTGTRSFSSGATYEYAGKVAQVTGDGLPASVAGLTVNDSLGVTLTNDVTVTGPLTFTAGKLATGTKAIRALGTVVSAGPGKFVAGKLHRLMNAPGAVKWDVGNENDYLPFSVYIKTISGGDTVGLSIVDRRVVPPTARIRDTSKVLRRYARLTNVGGIMDLKPDSMTIRYSDADVVAAGLREDTLKVYSSDGTIWTASQILGIDTVNNLIKVATIESPAEVIVSGVAPQFSGTLKDARLAPNGTEVAFRAIVTRTKGAFTYMQDTTAGMTVRQTSGAWFDSLASGAIRRGTVVSVVGVTSEFNGLKQINATDLKGFSIAWQDSLPQPMRLTLAQLTAGGENYEGMLVKVVSVKVIPGTDTVYLAAKTYNITDPTDTTKAVSLRIPNAADSDVDGKKIFPVITFTGVVGQFSATNPAVGYQLMAIEATDVTDNALAVEEIPAGVPQSFVLENNYPNPFNPSTMIVYGLPVQSRVTVKIYSLLGQEMRTLVNDVQGASYHRVTWDGTDNSGRHVSSGVYFVRIAAEPLAGSASPFVQAKKMVLMK